MHTSWDLNVIFNRPVEEAMEDTETLLAQFEEWRNKLHASTPTEDFAQLLNLYKRIVEELSKLNAYGQMLVDMNSSVATSRATNSKIDEFCSKADNRIRFFTHWWKGLTDEQARRFAHALGSDHYVFELTRKLRKHTLPEQEENLISIKDTTGVSALNAIYDTLSSRKVFTITVDGNLLHLTGDEIKTHFLDPRHEVRKTAYEEHLKVHSSDRDITGEIYRNIVLDWEHERELRKYESAITMRNKGNDLPDEVVHQHLEACREGAKVWQRYFKLKAKLLGITFTRFDLYAPMHTVEKIYEYTQAVQMTLDTFKEFSPKFEELAKEIYAGQYVDAFPRQHKAGGAYCWSFTTELPPFLLYNFAGRINDVTTVAHETGHGVHNQLCRHHSILSSKQPLPIAETASIFAEMLLTEHLRKQEHDPKIKRELLMRKLDELYGSIGRQSFFTIFEIDAHRLFTKGATIDEVSTVYLENLREQFGEVPEVFKDEWLAIPHFFHTPFYCYSYSFGNLLTLGLYELYRKEGKSFVPKYEQFLSAGMTKSPVDLCAEIGVDITQKSFWLSGFAAIERMIDEVEEISK